MEANFSIGKLARTAGCNAKTIRYYEEIGLMPPPMRTPGGQRIYDRTAIDRLAFIRHSRDLGFGLESIRALLRLADEPEQSCAAADRIARTQLRSVEQRIASLTALRAELERMIASCAGGRIASCRVIEVLANHRLCLHPEHAAQAQTSGFASPLTDGFEQE
jgi:Cu(I)-responsive transcriptional regulator